jgi:hypothetical protein
MPPKAADKRTREETLQLQVLSRCGGSAQATRRCLALRGPAHVTHYELEQVVNDRFDEVRCVEEMPSTRGGAPIKWEFCDPSRLITTAIADSPHLMQAYTRTALRKGAAPWGLVIGFDEYTPGSFYRPHTNRKSMNCFISFTSLGPSVLNRHSGWLAPITVRTTIIKQIR